MCLKQIKIFNYKNKYNYFLRAIYFYILYIYVFIQVKLLNS